MDHLTHQGFFRLIGQISILLCLVDIFFRFFQVGLQRKYWVKRHVFRWHMLSGVLLVFLNIYFIYFLFISVRSITSISIGSSMLMLVLCFTGLRMLVLVNRKDTRMRRVFGLLIVVFAQMACMQLAMSFYILSASSVVMNSLLMLLGRLCAFLAILFALFMLSLGLFDLLSIFSPAAPLVPEHDEKMGLPQFSLRTVAAIFSTRSNPELTHFQTGIFGSRFWPVLLNVFGTFPTGCVGTFISWQLLTLHAEILLGQGVRALEWGTTAVPLLSGLGTWGVFEVTIFVRNRDITVAQIIVWTATILLPFGIVLLLPSWFNTDFFTALLRSWFIFN